MKLKSLIAWSMLVLSGALHAETTLLNVSYDVAREYYKDFNPLFQAYWKKKTGQDLTLNQSHGPSSKQVMSIVSGLEADVVSMNQGSDVEFLAEKGLIPKNWAQRLPNNSSPFTSTMVFVVRQGNPKGLKDWPDLLKPGVGVILPNPKTAGNGRYTYLAAWAWAKNQPGGNDAKGEEFVTGLLRNVPILAPGGRAATTTFAQQGIGDVLITFENEVYLIEAEFGTNKFDVVYPSASILAELPVTVVDKVVDKRGTRAVAEAYLQYLYSSEGQQLALKHRIRPSDNKLLEANRALFKPIKLYRVEQEFGPWLSAQKTHFADGGTFDRAMIKAKQ